MNQSRRDFLYKFWALIYAETLWNNFSVYSSENDIWVTDFSSWWMENNSEIQPETIPIHITIDDGPSKQTIKMADELEKYWHKWIFFLVGKNIWKYKQDIIEILNRWHQIGNHSYSHPSYSKLSFEEIKTETLKANDIITEIISQSQQDSKQKKIFRYPFWSTVANKFKKDFEELLKKENYDSNPLKWDIDTNDRKSNTSISDIYQKIIATQIHKIVLIHEKEKTLQAMRVFSKELSSIHKIWITKLS